VLAILRRRLRRRRTLLLGLPTLVVVVTEAVEALTGADPYAEVALCSLRLVLIEVGMVLMVEVLLGVVALELGLLLGRRHCDFDGLARGIEDGNGATTHEDIIHVDGVTGYGIGCFGSGG
jgi:hypothetical protein